MELSTSNSWWVFFFSLLSQHDPYTKPAPAGVTGGQALPPFSSLTPGFPRPQQQQQQQLGQQQHHHQPYHNSLPRYQQHLSHPQHLTSQQQQQQQQQQFLQQHHQHQQQFSPVGQQSQLHLHHHQQPQQQQFNQGDYQHQHHQWQFPPQQQQQPYQQHGTPYASPIPSQHYLSPQPQHPAQPGPGPSLINGKSYGIHHTVNTNPAAPSPHPNQHNSDVNFPFNQFYPQGPPTGPITSAPQAGQNYFSGQGQHLQNYASPGVQQMSSGSLASHQLFSPDSNTNSSGGQPPADHGLDHNLALDNVHIPEGTLELPSSTDQPPQIPLSQIESILSTAEQPQATGSDTANPSSLPQLFDDVDQLPSWQAGFDQVPVSVGHMVEPGPTRLAQQQPRPQGALPSFNSFSSFNNQNMQPQQAPGSGSVKSTSFLTPDSLAIPNQHAQMNGFSCSSVQQSGWATGFHNNYHQDGNSRDICGYPVQDFANGIPSAQGINKFPLNNGQSYASSNHTVVHSNTKSQEPPMDQPTTQAKKPRKSKKKKDVVMDGSEPPAPAKPKAKRKPKKKAEKEKLSVAVSENVIDDPLSPGPCLSPTFIASLSSKRAPETLVSCSVLTSTSTKSNSFSVCLPCTVPSLSSSHTSPASNPLTISSSSLGSQSPAVGPAELKIVTPSTFQSSPSSTTPTTTTTTTSSNRSPSPNPISPGFLASLSASKVNPPPPPAKKRNKRSTSTGEKTKKGSKVKAGQAVSNTMLNVSSPHTMSVASSVTSSSVFGLPSSHTVAPVVSHPHVLPSATRAPSFSEPLHSYSHLQEHSSEFQYPTPPMEDEEAKMASPRPYLSPTFLASLSHQNGPSNFPATSFSSSSSPSSSQHPTLSPLEENSHLFLPTPPNSAGSRQGEIGVSKEEQTSRILEIIAREKEKQLQVKAAAQATQEPKKKKKKKSQQQKALDTPVSTGTIPLELCKMGNTNTASFNNQSFHAAYPNSSDAGGGPPFYPNPQQQQVYPGPGSRPYPPHLVTSSDPSQLSPALSGPSFSQLSPHARPQSQPSGTMYRPGINSEPIRHQHPGMYPQNPASQGGPPLQNGHFPGNGYQDSNSYAAFPGNRPPQGWINNSANLGAPRTPQHNIINGSQPPQFGFNNGGGLMDKARMCGPNPGMQSGGEVLYRNGLPPTPAYGARHQGPQEGMPGSGHGHFNNRLPQPGNQHFSATKNFSNRFQQPVPNSPSTNTPQVTNQHQWNRLQHKVDIKTEFASPPQHTQQHTLTSPGQKLEIYQHTHSETWDYGTVSTDLNHLEATVPAALENITPSLPALLQPSIKQEGPVNVNLENHHLQQARCLNPPKPNMAELKSPNSTTSVMGTTKVSLPSLSPDGKLKKKRGRPPKYVTDNGLIILKPEMKELKSVTPCVASSSLSPAAIKLEQPDCDMADAEEFGLSGIKEEDNKSALAARLAHNLKEVSTCSCLGADCE